MNRVAVLIMGLFVLCLLAGCGYDYTAEIESNTTWSGSFDGRTVEGSGNQTEPLGDEGPQCCEVQKETEEGYLKVRVAAKRTFEFFGLPLDVSSDWVETTAEYGVVSVCSK